LMRSDPLKRFLLSCEKLKQGVFCSFISPI
jgi:hypothetical protein